MRKVIIFGNYDFRRAWIIGHAGEYDKVNLNQGRLWKKDGSEDFLVLADHLGSEQCLRGQTIDQIEVLGPWNEHVQRAVEVANLCIRRDPANV